MSISANRILADIKTIAGFNESKPDTGFSRPTFSPSWRKARDYVIEQAKSIDCDVRIDAAGNVHVRPKLLDWNKPAWLSGSHIDSVPTGGKYDGALGIVAALEVLRSLPNAPLELIIFAEEEGTTFGIGMIGSRLWVGDLSLEELAKFKNADGQTYVQAGAPCGVRPQDLAKERFDRSPYRGLIELHIEQGPFLAAENQSIAIVNAIAGRKQYLVEVAGVANHAGAAPMNCRNDALAGAAEMIGAVERIAWEPDKCAVATVGRISCSPNAINVVPDRVEFTIDFRSPDDHVLANGHQRLVDAIDRAGNSRGLKTKWNVTEDQRAIPMDAALMARIQRFAGNVPVMASGALHDAAVLAPHLPTAMIFVASKDGISHNPREFSRIEDIVQATELLAKVVS